MLTRDEFREGVFNRDNHKCIICGSPAKDAHHIIERRLFTDGGYYLNNGASLCEKHHLEAESTVLSCDQIRDAAKITKIVLPEHFYTDLEYDKWGNIICPDGERLKGELFYDESVQKILDKSIVFKKYVKYPRTYHVPTSHLSKDDKKIQNYEHFRGKRVIVTEKLDGENTTMYNDYIHAVRLKKEDINGQIKVDDDSFIVSYYPVNAVKYKENIAFIKTELLENMKYENRKNTPKQEEVTETQTSPISTSC